MRIRDPMHEPEEPYNLVPLTDMVFNLLIFFMAATTFAQVEKEMGIELPRTSALTPLSAPPKQLIINIRQDGAPIVSGKTYTVDGLTPLIVSLVKNDPDGAVIIRTDERTVMRHFADVTRLCKQLGVREAKIVYLEDQPPSAGP
jgi:biopolymer transport protein ExbD